MSKTRTAKKVKENVIEKKDQRWHTRNRIQLTFGSNDIEEIESYLYNEDQKIKFQTINFHQAKSKAIEELLDNCIDEYYRGHVSEVKVSVSDDLKKVTVEDNGIGFPVDKIVDVYSEYRVGSKFKDGEVDNNGFLSRTLGQNGLGAAATCLTADYFKATVKHHNSKKQQSVEFIDGALKIKKGKVSKFGRGAGVKIEVILSPEVYGDNTIDFPLLRKRIIDLALNNPGLTFSLNKEKFVFKKGLQEMATLVNEETGQLIGEEAFVQEFKLKNKNVKAKFDLSFSIAYDLKTHEKERFVSFVNSTPTYDGGFHHDKARRFFINAIKTKLERRLKKEKVALIDADITTGITFILGIIMPNPRFESQTKRKLVKDYQLEKSIDELIQSNINKFFRRNPDFLEAIISRAKSRNKFEVLKDAAKTAKKSSKQKIEKLLDANEKKKRHLCSLFICEGDSAIGGLRSSRNKLYQGGIPLKGKPMNVSQATLKDILNNNEFSDIMNSIGLVLGEKAELDNMRFSKIIFLADSDVDGGHINALLINFFYHNWPELFDMDAIQIAKAPLFEVITSSGKALFAESTNELEKIKQDKRVIIKEIHRNKGLGEMSKEAWDYIMSKDQYTVIESPDNDKSLEMLNICFGKDTQLRKDFLLKNKNSDHKTNTKVTKKKVSKKTTKKKVRRR